MTLPTAIVFAGIAIGTGIAVGFFVLSILLLRIAGKPLPIGNRSRQEKVVAMMPEIGIEGLADQPKAIEKLRKKQDSTPSSSY